MKRKLDLGTWPRKDHFHFFKQFEEPFFGVCVDVDCTVGYATAKEKGISFFLYYLYQSLLAANDIVPFSYRIIDDEVFAFDQVNASPTITRPDGTFGFAYMDFHRDMDTFMANAKKEIDRVQQSTGLVPSVTGENVIHYSSLPWIRFTSISHARAFSFKDSIPKISFGRVTEENGKKIMPLSLHVHHALMDGYHAGEYLNRFQELMNSRS